MILILDFLFVDYENPEKRSMSLIIKKRSENGGKSLGK